MHSIVLSKREARTMIGCVRAMGRAAAASFVLVAGLLAGCTSEEIGLLWQYDTGA
jgi:hypothetical protein